MSVEPGTGVPLLDADDRAAAGLEAFLAADLDGLLALDALPLAGAFGVLADFFALVLGIVRIHLLFIVLTQPTMQR